VVADSAGEQATVQVARCGGGFGGAGAAGGAEAVRVASEEAADLPAERWSWT